MWQPVEQISKLSKIKLHRTVSGMQQKTVKPNRFQMKSFIMLMKTQCALWGKRPPHKRQWVVIWSLSHILITGKELLYFSSSSATQLFFCSHFNFTKFLMLKKSSKSNAVGSVRAARGPGTTLKKTCNLPREVLSTKKISGHGQKEHLKAP